MSLVAFVSSGVQSALEPAGLHAGSIATLWNVFLAVTGVVYVLVMITLAVAMFRRRRGGVDVTQSRGAFLAVSAATAVTVITLFVLLVSSVYTSRDLAYDPKSAITIAVTGNQWWWRVEYDDPRPAKRFVTANEIVIPAGQPVRVQLRSNDVIHSFWIPNLHGKQDLIPGHSNSIVLQANKTGVYRGQCAEFCGLQHAKMSLWVNVVPPADFSRWVAAQQTASTIPSSTSARKGQEVFMNSPCPLCHTIRGTDASGSTAPDLTHFASRRSIASGTLPNTRGYLAGWILDPQHIKPGNRMPPMVLQQGELQPLLDYLESLR